MSKGSGAATERNARPARTKPVQPADQLSAGKSFFSQMGLDVSHFGAIWHIFKIGQLMATDLNAVSGRHGLSIADFHLLGALMMSAPDPLRATDLAHALNVSNAALSGRVRRLAAQRLIVSHPVANDRRSRLLELTALGRDKVRVIGDELERAGRFVHHFRQLAAEDQRHLDRIVTALHTALARDFVPAPRTDS